MQHAGFSEMILCYRPNQARDRDHFDKAYELENELALKKRNELLRLVQQILPKSVNCVYIRQAEPLGLGHAVFYARDKSSMTSQFAVMLARRSARRGSARDETNGRPCMKSMAALYSACRKCRGSTLIQVTASCASDPLPKREEN
jgi:UTP-glucose-1-phosphate uridylyltransferase